ncbi:MAG: T9SS type A sorting domain-containing protein [Bacteroidales bacterium]|nr:T9SS type A sorting domain-containing protein [Bacteroidales bacterium]
MRRLLLTGLILSVSGMLHAQSGSRFPINPASAWRVDSMDAVWKIIEKTRYFIHGDTLINNLNYYKLYKSGVAFYDMPFYFSDVYVGAIREKNNSIYYIKKKKATEIGLYDFNLNVGDTIKSVIAKGKTIISVDSLPDGRKIFYYDIGHFTTGFLIEGIGTNGGLLSGGTSYIPLHSGECACHLICYAENGELVYQNTPHLDSNCDIVNPDLQYNIDPSAQWRYNKDIDNDTLIHYARYQYSISGDTLINSTLYYKLYKRNNELFRTEHNGYSCTLDENKYMGALRDQENKYYFVQNGSWNEELLYDFTLMKGEKNDAKIYYGETVFDVDTFLDNRKIIYFGDDYWNKKIIAGIGSTLDFLNEKEVYTYLTCYAENDALIYHNYSICNCELNYSDASFPACNSVEVMPNYIYSNSDKNFKIKLCYPVPAENGFMPEFSGYNVTKNGYLFKVDLYYNDANPIIPDQPMITTIITDTIPAGILEMGYYTIECSVNTIHTKAFYDTTYNDIRFDFSFFIWNNPVISTTVSDHPSVRIFPVPAKDRICIESIQPDAKITSVEIYNILGIKVFTRNIENSTSVDIRLRDFKKGIYILKINEANVFSTQKIIIE